MVKTNEQKLISLYGQRHLITSLWTRYGLAFITNQKLKKQDLQAAEK